MGNSNSSCKWQKVNHNYQPWKLLHNEYSKKPKNRLEGMSNMIRRRQRVAEDATRYKDG